MSYAEKLRTLAARIFGGEQKSVPELQEQKQVSEITIEFYDLRGEKAAEEHNVKPGYYLIMYPVPQTVLKKPDELRNLVNEASLHLMQTLSEEIPTKKSDVKIPVDVQEHYVDPDQAWDISPSGYESRRKILILRAEPIDRDEAQKTIVKSLRR